MNICSTCGGTTQGYKCAQCNENMFQFDPKHPCGQDMCLPKCAACGEAESKCYCGGDEDD